MFTSSFRCKYLRFMTFSSSPSLLYMLTMKLMYWFCGRIAADIDCCVYCSHSVSQWIIWYFKEIIYNLLEKISSAVVVGFYVYRSSYSIKMLYCFSMVRTIALCTISSVIFIVKYIIVAHNCCGLNEYCRLSNAEPMGTFYLWHGAALFIAHKT